MFKLTRARRAVAGDQRRPERASESTRSRPSGSRRGDLRHRRGAGRVAGETGHAVGRHRRRAACTSPTTAARAGRRDAAGSERALRRAHRASCQDAKTAYVAVDGHRSDVFEPLVADDRGHGPDLEGDHRRPPSGTGRSRWCTRIRESPSVLYCGTEFGCFVTLDGAAAASGSGGAASRPVDWVRINGKSLPPAPVDDIVMQHRERDLVAATHGRSLWILDDAGVFAQLTPALRERPLALFESRAARPRLYHQPQLRHRTLDLPRQEPADGRGHRLLGARPGRRAGEHLDRRSTGAAVRSLSATSRRGLNRVVWDLQYRMGKHKFDSIDEQWARPDPVRAGRRVPDHGRAGQGEGRRPRARAARGECGEAQAAPVSGADPGRVYGTMTNRRSVVRVGDSQRTR